MPAFDRLVLRTPRLLLRPLCEADAPELFAIFSDPKVMRYWSTPPWPSVGRAEEIIAGDLLALGSGERLRFGLERIEDGRLIGTCSLFDLVEPSRRAEIGYALAAEAWGRGYMREALLALLDYAFGELGLNRLEADIDPRNEASARSLERLGFRREGLLRQRWIVEGEVSDSALYGLLAADWPSRR
jgi:ribosomal-protein-alanine N-acetyltransferase